MISKENNESEREYFNTIFIDNSAYTSFNKIELKNLLLDTHKYDYYY